MLYVSGYAAGVLARDGLLDPDVLVLAKPYSADELSGTVRRALEG